MAHMRFCYLGRRILLHASQYLQVNLAVKYDICMEFCCFVAMEMNLRAKVHLTTSFPQQAGQTDPQVNRTILYPCVLSKPQLE